MHEVCDERKKIEKIALRQRREEKRQLRREERQKQREELNKKY